MFSVCWRFPALHISLKAPPTYLTQLIKGQIMTWPAESGVLDPNGVCVSAGLGPQVTALVSDHSILLAYSADLQSSSFSPMHHSLKGTALQKKNQNID